MSAQANLAFTVKSPLNPNGQIAAVVGNSMYYPATYANNSFWFLVIDRTTLKVVFNVLQQSNTALPTGIEQYASTQYILVVATVSLSTLRVPQGPLYAYLLANGGGPGLKRLEQISSQLNCGEISNLAYCLVDILGEVSTPGFEATAYDGIGPILTLQLMPIVVDGTTYWTPITLA